MTHTPDSITLRGELTKIWRKKFWVFGITFGAAILGYVFTLPWFTPVEHLSTAVIVPPNFNMIKSVNFQPGPYHGPGIATDEDLERMAHALNSDTVLLSIARQFNLIQRYDIDTSLTREKQYKMLKTAFLGKVTIKLSRFSTIEISVYDSNATTARDIATALVLQADSIVEKVALRREGLVALEGQLMELDTLINRISGQLGGGRSLSPIGSTLDMGAQPQAFAMASANNPAGYAAVVNGEYALWQYSRIRSELYSEYLQRKKDLETFPTYVSVVAQPTINYEKARPNRVITTLLSFIAGLLFSTMGILVADRFLGSRT